MSEIGYWKDGPNGADATFLKKTDAASGYASLAGLNGKVDKGSLVVNAADSTYGATRDQVQINAAVAAVVAAGGGRVFVGKADGPWTISRHVVGDRTSGGILISTSNVTLVSDGATLNLADNCDFIKVRSVLGSQVTITADTAASNTTLTVASSATFTVGQWVFLRMGQAAYDSAEPDFWLYALVSAIPDGTHVTLDRPVGYAMAVAGITSASQKSIAPVTSMAQDINIEGTWNLVNPMTGSANAESGIYVQYARNVNIENLICTSPGAGAIVAQFVDGLTFKTVRVPTAHSQNAQSSKGRVVNFAESRGVHGTLVLAEDFEQSPVHFEGRCEGCYISRVVLNNSYASRANTSQQLITTLGNSRVSLGSVEVFGNSSYFWGTGGSTGNDLRVDDVLHYTSGDPVISSLALVQSRLRVRSTLFPLKRTYWALVPLTANMSAASTTLPSGYAAELRVYASTTTGITSFRIGSTAALTADQSSSLLSGQTAILSQGSGFGSGYHFSDDTGKRIVISTDGTVPAAAYLVVEMTYWADPAANGADAALSARFQTPPHAATHQVGGSDQILTLPGQYAVATFEPIPWYAAVNRPTNVNGSVQLVYFTAPSAITVNKLAMSTGSTLSAGATLAKLGLYSVAANGDLTLVASVSDTTINQSGGVQSRTLGSGYALSTGARYALAWLVVGATTLGTYQGCTVTAGMTNSGQAGLVAAQTDLPATITAASVAGNANPPWLRAQT